MSDKGEQLIAHSFLGGKPSKIKGYQIEKNDTSIL